MTEQTFNGDKKDIADLGILGPYEVRFKESFAPKVPIWIKSHHLTFSTILWSTGVIFFSYLSVNDIKWLWLVSIMLLLQYFTDLIDGEVGRQREEGLPRWGFFMDHFLDYVFLCSILIGYGLIIPSGFDLKLFLIFLIFSSMMVTTFLDFGATNKFKIAYMGIGPTEIRFFLVGVNTLVIIFGPGFLAKFLPIILIFGFIGLLILIYKTHKALWRT